MHFLWQHPQIRKNGFKVWKIGFSSIFSNFYWGDLSKTQTLAQNGLETAKFLILVPHYNFCIVQWVTSAQPSKNMKMIHFVSLYVTYLHVTCNKHICYIFMWSGIIQECWCTGDNFVHKTFLRCFLLQRIEEKWVALFWSALTFWIISAIFCFIYIYLLPYVFLSYSFFKG